MLLAFSLANVLRATTACTFSTSQLLKAVRTWGAFSFFTCKRASRHNGVQFFISHLARWLHTRRFSEPTFRPSGATNNWKNTVFRDFPAFSRICIFFLSLSLLWSSLFYSSLLSDSSHLCFSSVHIVGSLFDFLTSFDEQPPARMPRLQNVYGNADCGQGRLFIFTFRSGFRYRSRDRSSALHRPRTSHCLASQMLACGAVRPVHPSHLQEKDLRPISGFADGLMHWKENLSTQLQDCTGATCPLI